MIGKQLDSIRELTQRLAAKVILEVHAGDLQAIDHMLYRYVTSIIGTMQKMQEQDPGITVERQESFPKNLDEMKRDKFVDVLNRTGWNKTEAARVLDINIKTLYSNLKRWGLHNGGKR